MHNVIDVYNTASVATIPRTTMPIRGQAAENTLVDKRGVGLAAPSDACPTS